MNKKLLGTMGAFIIVLLLALSSLAAAAPAAKNTPVPQQAVTATPVPSNPDDSGAGPADNAPDLEVGAAALAPVTPGPMTSKIIVFNPYNVAATVSIKIVNSDGSTAYTFPNFTVAKNGAVAKPLPSSISPFKGSAVVSSDKNVLAFVTDSNGTNTARDEYDGSGSPNANLVLPFVRHLAPNTQNSIIAVQNTSNGPANITLNLFNQSGTPVATQTINSVASNASAYFDTNNVTFPSLPFVGSAEISAGGVPIAASEQTRYLKDTASFRALLPGLAPAGDEGTKLYDGFVERQKNSYGVVTRWSELYARNDGASPTDITVKFYSSAGVLMTKATKTRPAVPPKGLAQFLTNAGEFGSLTTSTTYFKGWAVVTSSNSPQPMALYALDARSSGTQLFGTSGITSTGSRFACGDALRIGTPSQYSMINIVNPGGTSTSANVTIQVYKPGGAPGGTKSIIVGVNKLVSVSLSDSAFSTAGAEGLAVVRSTGASPAPIFASVFTPFGSGGITSYNCAGF